MLMAKSIGVTIIDKKPAQIELSEEFGTKVYYGDGLRIDLLRTAGAETARVIAFCNDNKDGEMTKEAVAAVLEAFPQAAVMVRAFDRLDLIRFDDLDLTFAERELFESAVVMGRAALKASGVDRGEIERVEREYRSRDCERLERQAATGDIKAGWESAFAADRPLPTRKSRRRPRQSRSGKMLLQRFDDRVDDILMRAVAALNVDVRLRVGGAPLLREPGEHRLGIPVTKLDAGIAA